MSLLSYTELIDIIDAGVITRVDPNLVNSASIDLRLGEIILAEHCQVEVPSSLDDGLRTYLPNLRRIHLNKKEGINTRTHSLIKDGPYILYPGEFILASSQEVFNLPNNISAEYKLNSSMARIGLEHLNAGWCDAGWNGSVLTLEIKNMTRGHEIVLEYGDKIGQIVFFRHKMVPPHKSYAVRGRYNNDKTVSGVKAEKEFQAEEHDEEYLTAMAKHVQVRYIPEHEDLPEGTAPRIVDLENGDEE